MMLLWYGIGGGIGFFWLICWGGVFIVYIYKVWGYLYKISYRGIVCMYEKVYVGIILYEKIYRFV